MTFFESLLALVFAAVVALQVSRRLGVPYPAMLALAGVGVAFIPGAPMIAFDPTTTLALFVAPVLLDAAYDFPLTAARQLWRPLTFLSVGAIVVTTAAVAWVGVAFAHLPLAAAIVLGAIVAPPDAAAATAVLSTVSLPRRTVAVLKGESLFNDATALLLFGAALAAQQSGSFATAVGVRLALAGPGGIVFGIAAAYVILWVGRFVNATLGGNILQFVNAFAVWIIAARLGLSPVLAVVACAMTVAARTRDQSPRLRIHSFAVWATVVFLLNVLAFLLMGLQTRTIIARTDWAALRDAGIVAAAVVGTVIVARIVLVMAWNRVAARFRAVRGDLPPPTLAQGIFVSWCGMRGLLTMATAFALPGDFPRRDVVVLAAFAVVLATLIVQGLSLAPLIRALGLDHIDDAEREIADGRRDLAAAATAALAGMPGEAADHLGVIYADRSGNEIGALHAAAAAAIAGERSRLEELRDAFRLGDATYYRLQEEIDWRELALLAERQGPIEET